MWDTREGGRTVYDEVYDLPTDSQKKFGGQIATHVSEYFVKVIMGQLDVDASWNSYVNEWGTLGGTKCANEVNEWFNEHK